MKVLSDVELGRHLFTALRNEPKFDELRKEIEELRRWSEDEGTSIKERNPED